MLNKITCEVLLLLSFMIVSAYGQESDNTSKYIVSAHSTVKWDKKECIIQIDGKTKLPDGFIIDIGIVPYAGSEREGDPAEIQNARVKEGSFRVSGIKVDHLSLCSKKHKIEARLNTSQPAHLRHIIRSTRKWVAVADVPRSGWLSRLKGMEYLLVHLRGRFKVLTHHEKNLLDILKKAKSRTLTRSEFVSWKTASRIEDDIHTCEKLVKTPIFRCTYPRATPAVLSALTDYNDVINTIDKSILNNPPPEDINLMYQLIVLLEIKAQNIMPDKVPGKEWINIWPIDLMSGKRITNAVWDDILPELMHILIDTTLLLDPGSEEEPVLPTDSTINLAKNDLHYIGSCLNKIRDVLQTEGDDPDQLSSIHELISSFVQLANKMNESRSRSGSTVEPLRRLFWDKSKQLYRIRNRIRLNSNRNKQDVLNPDLKQ